MKKTIEFVGRFFLTVDMPVNTSEEESTFLAQKAYRSLHPAVLDAQIKAIDFQAVSPNHVEIPKMVLDIIKNYWNTQLRRSKQSVDVVSLMRFTEGIAYAYGSSNKALSNKLYDICNNLNTSEFCEFFELK